MRDRGAGSIVHVASRPGLQPAAGQAAYALSKAALVYLIRVLDLELRPSGVRVNGVAPQLLNTAATRQLHPRTRWRTRSRRRPSPTCSPTSPATPPSRSAARWCPPTAPDRLLAWQFQKPTRSRMRTRWIRPGSS